MKRFWVWNPDENLNILVSEMSPLIQFTKSYNILSCFMITPNRD